jgi:uncharacterized membrane protein YdbT with pleckstrin-like domain
LITFVIGSSSNKYKIISMRTKLKQGEKVVLVIRPHWIFLFWPVLFTMIAIVAGILIKGYGYIIPFIFVCYTGYKMIERNRNLWAITDLRIIDEFGVFSLNSKESPLDKINNVSYNQTFWGRLFGFGNVQIQTAAEIGSTTYHNVEKPRELKDTITQMQEDYKKTQIRSQAEELAKAIVSESKNSGRSNAADEVEKLYDLKQKGILTEEEYIARKKKLLDS